MGLCTSHEDEYVYKPIYTETPWYMSDIYSITSYRYFGGTFRMAHLVSGWFCLNTDDFIECSCPDYSNCPKCKEELSTPQEETS